MRIADTLEKVIFYTYLVLLFVIPLSLETYFPPLKSNLVFFTEPLCIALIGLATLYIIVKKEFKFSFSLVDKLVAAHVLFVLLSTLFSDDWFVSIKYSVTLIWYVAAGYVIPRIIGFDRKRLKFAVIAHLAGVTTLCLYVLYNHTQLGIFYEASYQVAKPFIPVGHTNLSVVIEPAIIIMLGMFFLMRKDAKSLSIFGVVITIFMSVVIFSCSKSSYVTVFIICGLFVVGTKKVLNWRFIAFMIAPLVVGVGIWHVNNLVHRAKYSNDEESFYKSGSQHYDPSLEGQKTWKETSMVDEIADIWNTKENFSNVERLNRWGLGLDMYKDSPIMGVGMGTYPDKYLDKLIEDNPGLEKTKLTEYRMNIHNVYLSWLVEGGAFTFITGMAFFAMVVLAFIKYYKSHKHSVLRLTVFIFFVAYGIHGFVHDFSQDPRIIIVFWSMLTVVHQMTKDKDINLKLRDATAEDSKIV